MTPDVITTWLDTPTKQPDDAAIDTALCTWPWFTPMRMMDARRTHQQRPFSDRALSTLQLYSGSWLPAYALLTKEESEHTTDTVHEISGEDVDIEVATVVETPLTHSEDLGPEATESFIEPLYTADYFRYEGVEPKEEVVTAQEPAVTEAPQTLMVMMSFAEWLTHFKVKSHKEQEEAKEKSALRSMWQQEKLAAAMEDDPEEIPEDVFEMAVSSITKEDDIISEPLAQIYERQEKWGPAAEMYRKLALKYPAKSTYFASRAEAAKKRLL